MLVEHNEVVEDAIGPSAKTVDSSKIDMLAGLSMLYIFRTPPGFCADAVPPPDIEISNTPAATTARKLRLIALVCLWRLYLSSQRSSKRDPL